MNSYQVAFLALAYIASGIVAYKTRGIDYQDNFWTGLAAFMFALATIGLFVFGLVAFFTFLGQF
jgi:heme/copper-type cytochrome/quinol oxidase subunit 2